MDKSNSKKVVHIVRDRPHWSGENFGTDILPGGTVVHWVSREIMDRALAATRPAMEQAMKRAIEEGRALAEAPAVKG